MKREYVFYFLTLIFAVGMVLSYQKTLSAQSQNFAGVVPFALASGSVAFFDQNTGKIYIYDQNISKVIYVTQMRSLGQPIDAIEGSNQLPMRHQDINSKGY